MTAGALVAAGATTAAIVTLTAAVVVAFVGGVRIWRAEPGRSRGSCDAIG
jgi:hypothetical protein